MVISSTSTKAEVVNVSGWNLLDNHQVHMHNLIWHRIPVMLTKTIFVQVNLVSSLLTSGLCGLAAFYFTNST